MPKRNVDITLDINEKSTAIKFTAKQYEDIQLDISLKKNGNEFDVSNYVPNFYTNASLAYSCNIVENKVRIVIESESVIGTGTFKGEITLDDYEGTLKTPTFHFVINKSLSGEVIIEVKTLCDSEGYIIKDTDGNILKVRG